MGLKNMVRELGKDKQIEEAAESQAVSSLLLLPAVLPSLSPGDFCCFDRETVGLL